MKVFIEGNIGVGKTTLCEDLKTRFNYFYVHEPLTTYTSLRSVEVPDHYDLLANLYEKGVKDASTNFNFQMVAMTEHATLETSRWTAPASASAAATTLFERSLLTSKEVFTRRLFDHHLISDEQWRVYNFMWEHALKNSQLSQTEPSVYLYLHSDPITCKERIAKRGRPSEASISLDYLTELHSYHERWFDKNQIEISDDDRHLHSCVGKPYKGVVPIYKIDATASNLTEGVHRLIERIERSDNPWVKMRQSYMAAAEEEEVSWT